MLPERENYIALTLIVSGEREWEENFPFWTLFGDAEQKEVRTEAGRGGVTGVPVTAPASSPSSEEKRRPGIMEISERFLFHTPPFTRPGLAGAPGDRLPFSPLTAREVYMRNSTQLFRHL